MPKVNIDGTVLESSVKPDDPRVVAWLELHALDLGTPNQRERYSAGVLPEDELTQIARAELFTPFSLAETKRWRESSQIRKNEVRHSNCQGNDGRYVTFEVTDLAEITHDEWVNLKKITQLAAVVQGHAWLAGSGGLVAVNGQTHWATCGQCKVEMFRSSAKVSIEWAGRILTREYAL